LAALRGVALLAAMMGDGHQIAGIQCRGCGRRALMPLHQGPGEINGRQKLDAKKKRPIHMCAEATPFALAGVYDVWKGDGGKAITSFAIVTTDAAPSVAQYHNRMPVGRLAQRSAM
jgi:hypothetical protein